MANKTAREIIEFILKGGEKDYYEKPYFFKHTNSYIVDGEILEETIDQALYSLCDLIIPDVCSSCKESVRKSLGAE